MDWFTVSRLHHARNVGLAVDLAAGDAFTGVGTKLLVDGSWRIVSRCWEVLKSCFSGGFAVTGVALSLFAGCVKKGLHIDLRDAI